MFLSFMKLIHASAIKKLCTFWWNALLHFCVRRSLVKDLYYLNGSNFGYFSMTLLLCEINTAQLYSDVPIPVTARSKACVLRPLACWDCWFESRCGHGCLSLVSAVCYQIEISASG